MTRDELMAVIKDQLLSIAPEADADALDPAADLREAIDIDSMDFLNFVTALHQRLQVDIPDADAGKLLTLAGALDYLAGKLGV
ncbi:MAG TPA: phosphopantetheine-binding protein [Caulobacteraceae bacterium]|nr:phosphopantetheine-binding protein [Caulobacteraceae bacterium]